MKRGHQGSGSSPLQKRETAHFIPTVVKKVWSLLRPRRTQISKGNPKGGRAGGTFKQEDYPQECGHILKEKQTAGDLEE